MPSMKFIAFAMIFVGVIVNNYTFLHDLFAGKHDGWINLGTSPDYSRHGVKEVVSVD